MLHVLDNPIWNALVSGNKSLAIGSENAKYFKRDVSFFAGLKTNSPGDLAELHEIIPAKTLIVLFSTQEISVPAYWHIDTTKQILQMVYQPTQMPVEINQELVNLADGNIPAMMELTAMTKPGPFLERTIDFGHYEGIFYENKLVAMAGQRLQPQPYIEISAVCTHPSFTGKGYAASLIQSQIKKITRNCCTPFLHVETNNKTAINLYKKLGFTERTSILVYVLKK